jgi:uncharacterized protein DUF6519
MHGDLSRSTYRPSNHHSSVRLQQGRVLLDAEWNESADIGIHVDRTTAGDAIGACGAPKHALSRPANFAVTVAQNGRDLRIAAGRIYVDGILCENDEANGTLYTLQADLPGAGLPTANGPQAVYLDVWERHLTAVDQHGDDFPLLREPALSGPDTATRTRVVWQVKLAPIQSKSCDAFTKPVAPTGRLRAQEIKASAPVSDCLVPAGGGYRRLENQLYRVEIHDVGQGATSFKWSRDNGSIVSKVKAIDANALTIVVEDPGRDEALGFAAARWVELSDEERALRGLPGVLVQVRTVTGTSVTILNPGNLSLAVGTNPTLRRWDGRGTVAANTPLELEDGVQIEFDGGTVASGDYWLIPARTLTGKVEWPTNGGSPPAPVFESRHGTAHHYCLLAVVDFAGGSFANPLDCRNLFPPLTAIAASDVSYDPAACSNLSDARTVQEAIDTLCRGTNGAEPGIHIRGVQLMSGRPLENDALVDPQELSRGLRITCDRPPFQNSVRNLKGLPNPVCRLTLDLPWPITGTEREIWKVGNFGIVGFQPTTLAASVNSDGDDIFWVPGTQAPNNVQQWLADSVLSVVLAQTHGQIERVLARLTLEGNFIWGRADRAEYLDGDTFGVRSDQGTAISLPSGDGRRGGNFEMWFWLAAPPPPTPTVTTPTVTATFTRPTLTVTTIPTFTFTRPTLTQPGPTIATIVGPIRSPVGGGPSVIVPPGPDRGRATSRPLSAVEGLSRAQARKLQAAGIRDAAVLGGSDPRDVAAILALRDRAKAAALVEAAKRLSRPP